MEIELQAEPKESPWHRTDALKRMDALRRRKRGEGEDVEVGETTLWMLSCDPFPSYLNLNRRSWRARTSPWTVLCSEQRRLDPELRQNR